MSSYALGVDLGTTCSTATVHRGDAPEPVTLGSVHLSVPTVVFVADDSLVVGEAAADAARDEPWRAVREIKRRLPADLPLHVAGRVERPSVLLAAVLRSILERVTDREGRAPDAVALTHPAARGPSMADAVREIGLSAGIPAPLLVSEPEAAAIHHLMGAPARGEENIAVYGFGGGAFEAAVVRCDASGVRLIGAPVGLDHVTGTDIDDLVLGMVDEHTPFDLGRASIDDPASGPDLERLHEATVRAKVVLSQRLTARIAGRAGRERVDVRIVRGELEAALRPLLQPTLVALGDAIRAAGLDESEIGRVLLDGGSSRIPLVESMISERFRCPLALDVDPTNAVATGAALLARRAIDRRAATHASEAGAAVGALLRGDDGVELDLAPDRAWTVGRAASNDLSLAHDVVSRRHGEFVHDDGWVYRDLGSSNGSYLVAADGRREAVDRHRLRDGDVIALGRNGPRLTVMLGTATTGGPTRDR